MDLVSKTERLKTGVTNGNLTTLRIVQPALQSAPEKGPSWEVVCEACGDNRIVPEYLFHATRCECKETWLPSPIPRPRFCRDCKTKLTDSYYFKCNFCRSKHNFFDVDIEAHNFTGSIHSLRRVEVTMEVRHDNKTIPVPNGINGGY